MAIATSQQISQYYEMYKDTEVTFTRDIIRTLSMDPRQIYIKCSGGQWPCIINSTSFVAAKIIVGTKGGAFQQLAQTEAASCSLRFCFFLDDNQILSFFISGHVASIRLMDGQSDLALVTIEFSQRPPDDLIEMIGHLLDANSNFIKRKDTRIIINAETKRVLTLQKAETIIKVDGVPRNCIMRDISFGGAKVILMGMAQFLQNKPIELLVSFEDPKETFSLKGTIVRIEEIQGRRDIIAVNIKYDEASIPLSYKMHINDFISESRKRQLLSSLIEDDQTVNNPV